jgi:hypothetical protein
MTDWTPMNTRSREIYCSWEVREIACICTILGAVIGAALVVIAAWVIV